MKIDIRPIRAGKTTQLIKDSAEGFFYIVCHSHEEAYRISKQAVDEGFYIPFPLTYSEFISGNFNKVRINGFLIDNADMLLQRIANGVPIIGMTLTEPNATVQLDAPTQNLETTN